MCHIDIATTTTTAKTATEHKTLGTFLTSQNCVHTHAHAHSPTCYARTGLGFFLSYDVSVNSKAVTNESPSHGKHLPKCFSIFSDHIFDILCCCCCDGGEPNRLCMIPYWKIPRWLQIFFFFQKEVPCMFEDLWPFWNDLITSDLTANHIKYDLCNVQSE